MVECRFLRHAIFIDLGTLMSVTISCLQVFRSHTVYFESLLPNMVDVGTVGAIVGLCVAGVLGLYLLGACGAAPLLTRKPKDHNDDHDDPVRFSMLHRCCSYPVLVFMIREHWSGAPATILVPSGAYTRRCVEE